MSWVFKELATQTAVFCGKPESGYEQFENFRPATCGSVNQMQSKEHSPQKVLAMKANADGSRGDPNLNAAQYAVWHTLGRGAAPYCASRYELVNDETTSPV